MPYIGHSGRKGQGSTKRDTNISSYSQVANGTDDYFPARDFMSTCIDTPLSIEESRSLKEYTGYGYRKIRSALAGNVPMTPDIENEVNNIRSAIEKSSLKKNVQLFRGVTAKHPLAVNFDSLESGSIINDVSFQSTSLNPKIANQFTTDSEDWFDDSIGITVKILAPKGSRALPIMDSKVKLEVEMLLPDNANFQVLGVDKEKREVTLYYLGS